MSDNVNHPEHYTAGKVECIDALEAATEGLNGIEAVDTGNALKYLWRWKKKNGVEDLKKAVWYIKHLIEKLCEPEVEEGYEELDYIASMDATQFLDTYGSKLKNNQDNPWKVLCGKKLYILRSYAKEFDDYDCKILRLYFSEAYKGALGNKVNPNEIRIILKDD